MLHALLSVPELALAAGQDPAAPSKFDAFMRVAKPLLPIPGLLIVLPFVWLFFRSTWRELDLDAQKHRGEVLASGQTDLRPFIALVMCAVILTMQEYYGGRMFYEETIRPLIARMDVKHPNAIKLFKYDELYGFGWWAGSRVLGYTAVPFSLWKAIFPKDSLLDFGLRATGFFKHAWIYAMFLGVVLPAMWFVSREPDFGTYYPFYKQASRSWYDFLCWEGMYFCQFFALEMFFRGFWLGVLRKSFGSGAIFAMAVPYCMIHYGKPYLEANGAIIAGIALGSLAMKTKSIYQGFLVHITVAALMDWLALRHRHATPFWFWPVEHPPATPELTEALAKTIERTFGALVLVALLGAGAVYVLRRHRRTRLGIASPVTAEEDATGRREDGKV